MLIFNLIFIFSHVKCHFNHCVNKSADCRGVRAQDSGNRWKYNVCNPAIDLAKVKIRDIKIFKRGKKRLWDKWVNMDIEKIYRTIKLLIKARTSNNFRHARGYASIGVGLLLERGLLFHSPRPYPGLLFIHGSCLNITPLEPKAYLLRVAFSICGGVARAYHCKNVHQRLSILPLIEDPGLYQRAGIY